MGIKNEIDKHLDADEGLRNRDSLNRLNEPASPAVKLKLALLDQLVYSIAFLAIIITVTFTHFNTLPAMNAVIDKGHGTTFSIKTGKSSGQVREVGGKQLISIRDHVQLKRNVLIYTLFIIALC